jgi:5-methylcytosine-specific restriction endonuclease McrA
VIFPLETAILKASRTSVISTRYGSDHSDAWGIVMADVYPTTKVCTKCSEEKPLTDYNRARLGRYGLTAVCRECKAAEFQARYAPVKERNEIARCERAKATQKECGKCLATKPVSEFTPNKRGALGVNKWCKPCYNQYGKAYYRKTVEKRRAGGRAIRARDPEKYNAQTRAWRLANPDYYRKRYEAQREIVKARSHARYWADPEGNVRKAVEWAKRNPEKTRASAARRRVRKQSAPGRGVSGKEWKEVFESTLGLCSYCNERKALALDHIEPLSRGGEHDPDNLTPACKSCNCAKKQTPLIVWLARRMVA